MLEAITFDLWDTVIHDDSDEPKRAAMGEPSKREARRSLAIDAFTDNIGVDPDRVLSAYDTMEARFNHDWHQEQVTWTVEQRVVELQELLGHRLAPERFQNLVRALEEMELQIAPEPVPGAVDAIAELSKCYKLGVVSDAIYSPGRCLRQWLEMNGLIRHFSGFAFSDEVGRSKPHRSMFESVADQLDVRLQDMLHLGDRDHKDVQGPHALGMKAVLFTATRDRDKNQTTADAVCERYADLPAIIRRLASN